jgi:NNP family nitrate/nitrite transporter-like MFS transporter
MAQEIPMTKAIMGTIMGMYTLAGLFFSLIAGALADKFGCRWVFGGGTIIASLGGGLRYFTGSPIEIMICMFFLGAGLTIFVALMPKILSTWFPPNELGTVNGICGASITIAAAVAMATATRFMSPTFNGWRGTAAVLGCLSIAMGILWMLLYRDKQKQPDEHKEDIRSNFKTVSKIKDVWFFSLNYSFLLASVMILVSLLPVTLQERGINNAGELVAIFMAVTCLFKVVGGIASDKVGKRKIFLIFCGILLSFSIPPFLIFKGVPLIIALVAAGIAVGPAAPVLMTALVEMERIGPPLAGTAFGFINMIGTVGGFLGPVAAGLLIDQFGAPTVAFIFTAVLALIAGLVVVPSKVR